MKEVIPFDPQKGVASSSTLIIMWGMIHTHNKTVIEL